MYQTGGAVQGGILQEIAKLPQDQQKQIMTAFGKWAQSKGLNLQQLQGNEQVLEQALTQFLQEMQGAQKARLGAKLNYIRSLKGNAPEGMDIEYYKCGGQVKKKFVKKNACGSKGMAAVKAFKDKCGSKMKKKSCKEFGGEIQSDKCGSKIKKSKKELGGNIESDKCGSKMKAQNGMKTNSKISNKWTQKDDKKLLNYRLKGTKTPAEKKDSINIQQKWNRLPEKEKAKYEVQEQKCGGKAKKHFYGGSLNQIPFYQGGTSKGGIKRFSVSHLNGSGTKYFDTEEQARAYQKTQKQGTTVRRDGGTEWRGSVLKADRTGDTSTAYARQQAEAPYNKLSFKDAYALARKNGVRWFGYKGKVYKSDLEGKAAKNNLTDMEAIYGNNLGWSKDPKMKTKASQTARANYRKQIDAKQGNRNATYQGKTNKQASKEADKQITWDSADFLDLMSPQTVMGNFIDMGTSALTGEKYTPSTYKAGYNVLGLAKDMHEGNYGNAAFRGLDAYLTLGAPGASRFIDYAGTRFAPRLTNLSAKSRYIPKGGTVQTSGGRTLNNWNLRSLSGNNTSRINGYGMRSMQRAANEGVLDRFAINGGINNATRYGNAAVQNANTGTTYIYRNVDKAGNLIGNSYDNAIDAATKFITPFAFASEPIVQQANK